MGEDITPNSRLFEIPPDGKVVLPELQQLVHQEVPPSVLEQIDLEMRIQEINIYQAEKTPFLADFGSAGKAYLLAYYLERRVPWVDRFYSVYEVDLASSGEVIGSGSSLIDLDNVKRETTRPYMWHTNTNEDYQDRGLGMRRLVLLNEINKRLFRDSLGSGSLTAPEPVHIWERLVEKGLVIKEGEGYRFR